MKTSSDDSQSPAIDCQSVLQAGRFALPVSPRPLLSICVTVVVLLATYMPAKAQVSIDIEAPPFEYSETPANNCVSRLIEKLDSKQVKLEHVPGQGYLRSMLKALEIPESSQTLVFSKTSLQVRYISRRNPRAIYFNDDTYVGWVRGSSLMEISTADPKLGTAFYTVDMMPWRPKVEQAYYDCLACHATSMTRGIPGHTVRSVFPQVDGTVDSQKKSFITDHTSPIAERWGGWYVTGRHGPMQHMGNAFLRGGGLDTRDNGNRLSLWDDFDTHDYLSPYSDIVALMVLEHQTQMHNAMVRADFSVRQLAYERDADAEAKEEDRLESDAPESTDSTDSTVSTAEWNAELQLIAKEVVDCLLFCNEAPLTAQISGSVIFADDFTKRGPKDDQGRSLRDFDLKTRMFKYPCSYLIYSPTFDALQNPLREEVCRQLHAVLSGVNQSGEYAHLDSKTRSNILAILQATKPAFSQR